MAAIFYPYPAGLETSDSVDRHWKTRAAVNRLRASLKDWQPLLERRVQDVLAGDDSKRAASRDEAGSTMGPAKFTRRLLLSTDQPLNIPSIMHLNRLYRAESEYLEATQDMAIFIMLAEGEFGRGDPAQLQKIPQVLSAYHKEFRRTTDRFTDASECTAHVADTPTPAGRSIELDFAELLENFFEICQNPNEAEIQMLSTVCSETEPWVKQWFVERRTQTVWLRPKVGKDGTKKAVLKNSCIRH